MRIQVPSIPIWSSALVYAKALASRPPYCFRTGILRIWYFMQNADELIVGLVLNAAGFNWTKSFTELVYVMEERVLLILVQCAPIPSGLSTRMCI